MKKNPPQCPKCFEPLEVRNVAPCDDCGWDPEELNHFKEGKHTYNEFDVYGAKLILCDFCEVDFSSYDPTYWGFPKHNRVGYGSSGFIKVREVAKEQLTIKKSLFCHNCKSRLSMIEAVLQVNENNKT
ncbi:MAG: hypothetical protein GY774_15985 [Planctomycetes bacterium]|nr:hypothetical protein [Planctomycetota bacterium]